MTSIAFPPLKKTVTDIMDEELYHLPQSPIYSYGNCSDSPKPLLMRTASNRDSLSGQGDPGSGIVGGGGSGIGNGIGSGGGNHNVYGDSTNLSSLLNIPDLFIDQYNKMNGGVSGGNNNNNSNNSNNSSSNSGNGGNSNSNSNSGNGANASNGGGALEFGHALITDEWPGNHAHVNPFRDYGNPDTYNTQHQNQAFVQPQELTRRRRITTLDEDSMAADMKMMKDKDFYLYNPDIQPSELIGNKNFMNGDFFYSDAFVVPSETNGSFGVSMADIQLDYMDQFDEEDEEELSDDDDDDDNYFHDDFDDMFQQARDSTYFDTANFPRDDTQGGGDAGSDGSDGSSSNSGSGEYDEDVGSSMDQSHEDDMMLDDIEMDNRDKHRASVSTAESSVEPATVPTTRHSTPTTQPTTNDIHKTAAEISATNPNHQCDLINPATGHPCHKQFSRPYDLIRHQETIHAPKKKIFRCVICEGRLNGGSGNGKLKTFSRGDALSRHIKVKHGLVGKDALDLINEAKENVEYVSV